MTSYAYVLIFHLDIILAILVFCYIFITFGAKTWRLGACIALGNIRRQMAVDSHLSNDDSPLKNKKLYSTRMSSSKSLSTVQ